MHAFGNVRVHSPSHAGFVAFAFFQFAACYDAHLPSVTVRDENAGRAHPQALCSCRTAHRQTVWPAWDDDDAMHRDVCRQSERRNTVQRDHGGHLPETAATSETKHVRRRGCSRERMQLLRLFRAVQCCSRNACKSQASACHLRQLGSLTDRQLPHRIAVKVL
jgi:hypothetical protein